MIKQMILDDIGIVDGCWMMDIDATEDDVGWCDGLMLMLLLIGDDGLWMMYNIDVDNRCWMVLLVVDNG